MVDTGAKSLRDAITDPRRLDQHIVDILIEERARHLLHRPVIWPMIKTFLYPALQYREARRMADTIAGMGGFEIFDWLCRELSLKLDVTGLEHLPARGPCVIVANHPTGIVDGLALFEAVRGTRRDLCYFANRDALRVAPRLAEVLIPVEWVIEKRSVSKTRDMVKSMNRAFEEGQALIMFPSGRVAQRVNGRLVDRPWQQSTINLVRRNNAPIIPLHMSGRNSWIYYFFAKVSQELRDMTLFNELLNKRGKTFRLTFGAPIPPDDLKGPPESEILRLRKYVEEDLPRGIKWQT